MYDLSRNVHRITLYSTVSSKHQHPSNLKKRLYLHVDMNSFYAQVEQQCYNLYGIPVIVGGWRKENGIMRGIVATSSYEARSYGVKTGISAYEAVQMCPYIVPLQVHYEKYQAISKDIRKALHDFAPEIEGYSMDEYFLDLSFFKNWSRNDLRDLGIKLKNKIYKDTQLICSVGISYSKTYAKLASDLQKPDGLSLILDEGDANNWIYPLSIGEVWGIGRKRRKKLESAGIKTIQDAITKGRRPFQKLFGDYFGNMLYDSASGKDCAKVMEETEEHIPKGVSYMHTFSEWTLDPERVKGEIIRALRQLCYRMRGYNSRAEQFSGYIRFQDDYWRGISFEFHTPGMTNLEDYIQPACLDSAMPLVRRFLKEGHRVRGIGLHTIAMTQSRQVELFFQEDYKKSQLAYAIDKINNKFGIKTLVPASSLVHVEGNTHFLER